LKIFEIFKRLEVQDRKGLPRALGDWDSQRVHLPRQRSYGYGSDGVQYDLVVVVVAATRDGPVHFVVLGIVLVRPLFPVEAGDPAAALFDVEVVVLVSVAGGDDVEVAVEAILAAPGVADWRRKRTGE